MFTRESIIEAYFNRRMAALLGLGFAAGLPSVYFLLGSTLQAWLLAYDYDVATVGLFALVGLPFAFNFAWAPLLDRFEPPVFARLGRRRGWLLLLQIVIVVAIVGLALAGPTQAGASLTALVVAGLFTAFAVASHDVVADAYRTDVLPDAELGAGAAVFVNGYRVGMLAAGGGALLLAEHLPWRVVYFILAGLMGVGMIATLCAPQPPGDVRPQSLRDAVVEPVREYFLRTGAWGIAVLAFVVLFKLPDALARVMTMPLLLEGLEFTNKEVALVREGFGLGATIVGALAGGAVIARLSLMRAIWLLIALQAVSNLGFCILAMTGRSVPMLFAVVGVENFCAGMVTAGFIAFLMSQCDRRYSATQYALFASLNYFAGLIGGAPTGFIVESTGYAAFFAMTVAAGLPAAALWWAIGGKTLNRERRGV